MSVYSAWKTATIDISSDDDLSNEVDLGGNYDLLQIILPTLTSCQVSLQVSDASGGTYQDLGEGMTLATGTGGYATVVKLGGFQFIKIKTSASQGADRSISVRGMRY